MNAVRNVALIWLVAVLLAGCQMFAPKTVEEGIGAAYVTIAAVADTAAVRVTDGAISTEDATRVRERLHEAKGGVDAAVVALATGQGQTADERLAAAIAILTVLEKEMSE